MICITYWGFWVVLWYTDWNETRFYNNTMAIITYNDFSIAIVLVFWSLIAYVSFNKVLGGGLG